MTFLLAGFLASALAWFINRWFLRVMEEGVVVYIAPFVEESAKTMTAVAVGASIFFTHATFGAVEAIWDIFSSQRAGIPAGAASFFGHMIFGCLAEKLFLSFTGIFPAVVGSYASHVGWNLFVMKVLVRRQIP